MIGVSPSGVKIMVATQPVDFRRGMNGLVALVASALAADPYCGDVFVYAVDLFSKLFAIESEHFGGSVVISGRWQTGRIKIEGDLTLKAEADEPWFAF